jgi:hypothetical protein
MVEALSNLLSRQQELLSVLVEFPAVSSQDSNSSSLHAAMKCADSLKFNLESMMNVAGQENDLCLWMQTADAAECIATTFRKLNYDVLDLLEVVAVINRKIIELKSLPHPSTTFHKVRLMNIVKLFILLSLNHSDWNIAFF